MGRDLLRPIQQRNEGSYQLTCQAQNGLSLYYNRTACEVVSWNSLGYLCFRFRKQEIQKKKKKRRKLLSLRLLSDGGESRAAKGTQPLSFPSFAPLLLLGIVLRIIIFFCFIFYYLHRSLAFQNWIICCILTSVMCAHVIWLSSDATYPVIQAASV